MIGHKKNAKPFCKFIEFFAISKIYGENRKEKKKKLLHTEEYEWMQKKKKWKIVSSLDQQNDRTSPRRHIFSISLSLSFTLGPLIVCAFLYSHGK